MTTTKLDEVQDLKTLATHVGDYLRGYGRNNTEALNSLISYRFWALLAQRELDARATRFISIMGNEELEAIARGDLNLSELAREIAQELKRGQA